MFFEEKRIDDNNEEFYICRLFDIAPVSQHPISVADEFFYLYDEKTNTFEEIYLKVEKIALRPKVFIDTIYYGQANMSLTNFKL